jgi:AraC-like DNA-binding protein
MWHFAPRMTRDSQRDARKAVPAPAGYLRLLLQRFATTPALRARLIEGTDIDETRLGKPGAEVTLYTYETFSENLTRIVGETWPLDALDAWGTATQGALDVAVRSAATIGEGVEILRRFGHVRGPYLQLGISRTARATTLSLSSQVSTSEATRRAMTETAALSAMSMLALEIGDAISTVEFHFPWAPPSYADRMRAALKGRVKFNQARCALVLPNALCAQASPYADEALLATALADLERSARRLRSDDLLTMKIERLLKRKRTGRVSEDEVARELGLSRRTLVRRLAESGTSYRALLDANLRERARAMLTQDKLSRTSMAEALGFEDPTSFSRACRRWFKTERRA